MVYIRKQKGRQSSVYTYGVIIHNEEVVWRILNSWVHVVGELKELEKSSKGKIIIRSHGILHAENMKQWRHAGFEVLVTTCPLKIHRLVESTAKKGYQLWLLKRTSPRWKRFSDGWKDNLPIRSWIGKMMKITVKEKDPVWWHRRRFNLINFKISWNYKKKIADICVF